MRPASWLADLSERGAFRGTRPAQMRARRAVLLESGCSAERASCADRGAGHSDWDRAVPGTRACPVSTMVRGGVRRRPPEHRRPAGAALQPATFARSDGAAAGPADPLGLRVGEVLSLGSAPSRPAARVAMSSARNLFAARPWIGHLGRNGHSAATGVMPGAGIAFRGTFSATACGAIGRPVWAGGVPRNVVSAAVRSVGESGLGVPRNAVPAVARSVVGLGGRIPRGDRGACGGRVAWGRWERAAGAP